VCLTSENWIEVGTACSERSGTAVTPGRREPKPSFIPFHSKNFGPLGFASRMGSGLDGPGMLSKPLFWKCPAMFPPPTGNRVFGDTGTDAAMESELYG